MSLTVKHEIVTDSQDRIKYKIFQEGGREHYNLRLWLDGTDEEMEKIEKAKYVLHPSFRRRNRYSSNREKSFSVSIWTWGMFTIQVELALKDEETQALQYYLSYELPPDTKDNYVAVKTRY